MKAVVLEGKNGEAIEVESKKSRKRRETFRRHEAVDKKLDVWSRRKSQKAVQPCNYRAKPARRRASATNSCLRPKLLSPCSGRVGAWEEWEGEWQSRPLP